MKRLLALAMLLGMTAAMFAQDAGSNWDDLRARGSEGILRSFENANLSGSGEKLLVTPRDTEQPVKVVFVRCQGVGMQWEQNQWWVLPISAEGAHISTNRGLWVLPVDASSKDHSWYFELEGGQATASMTKEGMTLDLRSARITVYRAESRPHSDPLRHRFSFKIAGGVELENALAGFYWGTMLPSVVEKTLAVHFPYSSGYVLSTLNVDSYAGSYPAVDHEFQTKGRLAMGSEVDLDIVKRMIELQFRLMNDDPERLSRAPTSVQPDGTREYHIRRSSLDNHRNAAMFPLTGNIEVIEETSLYHAARKDVAWLRSNIGNLEEAARWVLANTDQYGRVWSDVYYEDQVIKDGRETQAQAFAAHSFELLAGLERTLGRIERAGYYIRQAKKMTDALIAPTPLGYWDGKNRRFVDWVDRLGHIHDHIHLVANTLPVIFGYATPVQAASVRRMVDDYATQFERFPSFLSAEIDAYNKSEIGDGGPYDLSAAGRYWYWDAAYREKEKERNVLLFQLKAVTAEGAKDKYFMGERYDMDYVYYVDGKNAHGAEKYYEYPNVYAAILIAKYLGLTIPADADVSVMPHVSGYGSVEYGIDGYALRYSIGQNGFVLRNLEGKPRRFKIDLSGLDFAAPRYLLRRGAIRRVVGVRSIVTLAPYEEAHWIPKR